ncbi:MULTISPECIES: T9SS type A sorting domain-containing protein [unclassified Arenibacter]|jgi:hypothetical protein|uniref:T9SS type A sorting domain-containing protein n=1 Tax=unclassified Arenibacter TaxID=2615047 RepID=UPI000E340B81|nr:MULTISPECIES: T9SS type A sorting domain-containing protein [unclassified Arenibacter]MCM4163809.1 T9SS C-terminal target domain-containing protein [Arenibacter sp. A80]RFT56524.1 T9SS C-terminal target domain-containing protein [Arenibacter sp. P308M17]
MKQLYLVVALLFFSFGFGQEPKTNGSGADIPGFKIYPNPVTNGRVYISTSLNAPKQILVFDIFGSQVLETTIIGSELNVSDLDAGVYVLRVNEKNKIATRKLIIK